MWPGSARQRARVFLCRSLRSPLADVCNDAGMNLQRLEETKATVASMRQLLETKHARLAATLDGNYPQLKHSVWQSEASQQSAVQTLMPQMTENKAKVHQSAAEGGPTAWHSRMLKQSALQMQHDLLSTENRKYCDDLAHMYMAAAGGGSAAGDDGDAGSPAAGCVSWAAGETAAQAAQAVPARHLLPRLSARWGGEGGRGMSCTVARRCTLTAGFL